MAEYSQTSRYYNVDTEFDLPQINLLNTNYSYDTATV